MKIYARSMSASKLPFFEVSGGILSSEQIMGWHITDENGFTLAVSCDDGFSKTVNELSELSELLNKIDVSYHLKERYEDGYIQCDKAIWERIMTLMDKHKL